MNLLDQRMRAYSYSLPIHKIEIEQIDCFSQDSVLNQLVLGNRVEPYRQVLQFTRALYICSCFFEDMNRWGFHPVLLHCITNSLEHTQAEIRLAVVLFLGRVR